MEEAQEVPTNSPLNDRVRYSIVDIIGNVPVRDEWARELGSVISALDARKLQPLRSFLESHMHGIATAAQVGSIVADISLATIFVGVGVDRWRKVTKQSVLNEKQMQRLGPLTEATSTLHIAKQKKIGIGFGLLGGSTFAIRPISLLSYGAARGHIGERVATIVNRIALTPEEKMQKEHV